MDRRRHRISAISTSDFRAAILDFTMTQLEFGAGRRSIVSVTLENMVITLETAFVKRVKSFVGLHVSILYVCNIFAVEIAQGRLELNVKCVSSVLNVDDTSTINILQVVYFPGFLLLFFPVSLKVIKTVQSITCYLQDVRLNDMHGS
jgi:hypothetical protein